MNKFKIFIRNNWLLNIFYRPLSVVYTLLIYIILSFELFVYFLKNLKIFNNKVIYLFWTWSFGHQVQSYDWISRYYDSDKISLIHIPHPRNNNYLQYCFEDRFDAFAFTSKFFLMSHKVGEISHKIAKFFLYMIKIIKKEIIFMYDHNLVYQSFSSKKNKKFKIYDVETKSMSETSNY